jgi:hypothetical protein
MTGLLTSADPTENFNPGKILPNKKSLAKAASAPAVTTTSARKAPAAQSTSSKKPVPAK